VSELQFANLEDDLVWAAPSVTEAVWQYDEIFKQGCYDAVRLPEQPFVVDVGANIGLFALFVKRRNAAADILAFEPMPDASSALLRNADRHGLDRIVLHRCALGHTEEAGVPFTYYPLLPGNSTRFPEQKQLQKEVLYDYETVDYIDRLHSGYEVRTSVHRLSSFLPGDRVVDLLKVDVEGSELDVLLGVDTVHWPLINQVIIEVQDLNGRLDEICDLLSHHGLKPTVMPAPLIPPEIVTYVVHAARH
jgi:FkbM family methyltransferase